MADRYLKGFAGLHSNKNRFRWTAEISKDREIIMDKQQAHYLIKTFEKPFDKVRFISIQDFIRSRFKNLTFSFEISKS
jgi:hypothetical protein